MLGHCGVGRNLDPDLRQDDAVGCYVIAAQADLNIRQLTQVLKQFFGRRFSFFFLV